MVPVITSGQRRGFKRHRAKAHALKVGEQAPARHLIGEPTHVQPMGGGVETGRRDTLSGV